MAEGELQLDGSEGTALEVPTEPNRGVVSLGQVVVGQETFVLPPPGKLGGVLASVTHTLGFSDDDARLQNPGIRLLGEQE